MKSFSIKFPFSVNDLLSLFDKLDTSDLQNVADRISNLISKRNNPSPEEQEAKLLTIINQKLPIGFLNHYEELKLQMERGELSKSNILELEAYVERIEDQDTKKIEALHELSKLRKVSFQKLAK